MSNVENFTPLNGNIIIKRDVLEETNKLGLYVGNPKGAKSLTGTVIKSSEETIKLGMKVLIPSLSGTRLVIGEVEYTVIKLDDIIGLLG